MGLFSSKKVTTVDTSVSRVIEDKLLPDFRKTGMARALFAEDGQMIEHVLESAVNSVGVKAERMYQYGKRTYLYGLPKSTLFYSASGKAVVEEILSTLANADIAIEYYKFGPLNNLHYGWQTLVDSYGYDQASNEIKNLSVLKGAPVYLSDIQVVVVQSTVEELENGSLAQWGIPATAGYTPLRPAQTEETIFYKGVRKPTPFAVDATATSDYFRVSYAWQTVLNGKKTIHTESLQFPMSTQDPELDYFQVNYTYQEVGKPRRTTKYWTYQSGAGTYPALDTVFTSEFDDLGSFFPLAYFRYNKTPTSSDPASTEYKHSKRLLKYLDMDYDQVRDAVNANPDIEDVQSALIMMAVPARTTNPMERRYLFDFFKHILSKTGELALQASQAFSEMQDIYIGRDNPRLSMVIQDARFKMTLQMAGLYRRFSVGTIGPKGSYSSGYSERSITEGGVSYSSPEDTVGTPFTQTFYQPCHSYQHQLTDTVYEEIQVYNLGVKYFISGKYADAAFEQDPSLLIPVDHDISSQYSASEREELYARSLHYLFNTKIVTKVKWYQQAWFKMVILVVAVVISILTFNPGPLMAAIAAGGIVLAQFIAMVILEGLLYSMALKLFVKLVGEKFAMLVAVVAACYALGSGALNGGSLEGVPWGEELLQLSAGLSKTITGSLEEDLAGLQKDFLTQMKEQDAVLEKANKLLEQQHTLSPFVFFGESSTDYFNRTIHSGNIGVIGLDAVANYCSTALTLPKLSQTVGDSFNTEAFAFNNLG